MVFLGSWKLGSRIMLQNAFQSGELSNTLIQENFGSLNPGLCCGIMIMENKNNRDEMKRHH